MAAVPSQPTPRGGPDLGVAPRNRTRTTATSAGTRSSAPMVPLLLHLLVSAFAACALPREETQKSFLRGITTGAIKG